MTLHSPVIAFVLLNRGQRGSLVGPQSMCWAEIALAFGGLFLSLSCRGGVHHNSSEVTKTLEHRKNLQGFPPSSWSCKLTCCSQAFVHIIRDWTSPLWGLFYCPNSYTSSLVYCLERPVWFTMCNCNIAQSIFKQYSTSHVRTFQQSLPSSHHILLLSSSYLHSMFLILQ